jgi:hypothetical protein
LKLPLALTGGLFVITQQRLVGLKCLDQFVSGLGVDVACGYVHPGSRERFFPLRARAHPLERPLLTRSGFVTRS